MTATSAPRTIVVTGAGGALGTALARRFAEDGAVVVRADLTAPPRWPGTDGDRHPGVTCDVTVPADLAGLVETAIHRTGRLDVVVNCAGITHRSPAATTDPDLLAHVMAVNWEAPMRLSQLALPHLAAVDGSIVNLSSMAAWMPVPGRAGYGASKAALTQFMEVLRHEAATRGVNVLNVHPSFLDAVMPDQASVTAPSGPDQPSPDDDDEPDRKHPDRSGPRGTAPSPSDPRPRTSVGRALPVDDLAAMIVEAEAARVRWLFPDRLAYAASLLWRVAPGTFHRLMARRFAAELNPAASGGRT